MTGSVGRPRNKDVDSAIIEAAKEILTLQGFDGLTLEALATRAGTTRPAFYRRYSDLPSLVLALLLSSFATDVDFNTGSLHGDLLAIQEEQIALFSQPMVMNSLPGFLAALRSDSVLAERFQREFFYPRREATARVLLRGVERGEIQTVPDIDWICDLLTGPVMMRSLMAGLGSVDENLALQTTQSALDALRRPTA